MNTQIVMAMLYVGLLIATQSLSADEPEILPDEITSPGGDWNDAVPWGGEDPPATWYENTGSRNCQIADDWCAAGNATEGQA